jgi:FKBP-type peptidyl-prolyl cis-trans isomerase
MHLAALLFVMSSFGPGKVGHPTVKITDIKKGSGVAAHAGDQVTVDYVGTLKSGKVFDQSKKGNPFSFTLGARQVIPGWDQGLVGMKVGGKRKLYIPSALAYGPKGFPGLIPPNSDLIFVVILNKIQH